MTYNLKKYDKEDRLIYAYDSFMGTTYKYEYTDLGKTTTIINWKNQSNFRTIIEEELRDNVYFKVKQEEEGIFYTITTTYDDYGRENYIERINNRTFTCSNTFVFYDEEGKKIFSAEGEKSYRSIRLVMSKKIVDELKKKLL